MNATPAVDITKTIEKKARGNRRLAKKGSKKAKVIDFNSRKNKKKTALTAEEQQQTILEYRLKARTLAHSILRRWNSRLDAQEVESTVDLSLCEAVRRFNPSVGASFITFMFYHLRGNLIRAVTAAASLNYLPLADLDGGDSSEGSANAIDVAQILSGVEAESPDSSLLKKEVASLSAKACQHLDPLEREVIYRIYVLEEQLMDIARSLGYSRCHISRVKKKALDTLQESLAPTLDLKPVKVEAEEEEVRPRIRLLRRRSRARRAVRPLRGDMVVNG